MCSSHNEEDWKSFSSRSRQTKGNLPNIDHDLMLAKSILQRGSQHSGATVFDHLSDLIKRIIDDDPPNVADYFDEYSRVIREEKFNMDEINYLHGCDFKKNLIRAINIMNGLKLSLYPELKTFGPEVEQIDEELDVSSHPLAAEDLMQMHFYWKLCGFGVELEPFILSHSIEKFASIPEIKHCKFFGKIFALRKNYYILEIEFTPEENSRRIEAMKNVFINDSSFNKGRKVLRKEYHDILEEADLFPGYNWKGYSAENLARMRIVQPSLPKRDYEVSALHNALDIVATGLNHYSYFVCNDPLDQWIELPIVTPEQIMLSRLIKKYLTGNLNATIISHPPFPGLEKHYLRALIARITCGTYVSPIGYLKDQKQKVVAGEGYDEEEEVNDVEKLSNNVDLGQPEENSGYKSSSPESLFNMKNWVHTRPAILDDGGCVSYSVNLARNAPGIDTEEYQVEDFASRDRDNLSLPYKITTLLNPISDDTNDLNVPCWSLRVSCHHTKKNMVVIVKSNIWPGSYSFAVGNAVHHLYVGWGHKSVKRNQSPMPLSDIQKEYIVGQEIIEILDSIENYVQINNLQQQQSQGGENLQEESEEEELEDEEDDDEEAEEEDE